MEVYILDELLRRIAVIDLYESFIWTERWSAYGDFQLVLQNTVENRRLLTMGTRIVQNNSDRVMTVETIEIKKDSSNKNLMTIHGRSIEQMLEDRVATDGLVGLLTDNTWPITGTPGAIARYIFQKICRDGILKLEDKIPFITDGTTSTYPANTIAEPSISYSAAIPISTVYKAITDICTVNDLGFRLVRNLETSQLYFDIYTGDNRTTQQSTLTAVVFSSNMDSLSNTTELVSRTNSKNVAYVFSKNGAEVVYSDGATSTTAGFDRRVLFVDATDVPDAAGAGLTAILVKRGQDELAKNRPVSAFDGEISRSSPFKYGIDYRLGDIVEMRNSDGATNNMRVTEQIFVADAQGERSYPTLAIQSFITPGSWDSWDAGVYWDTGGEETWDE